MKLHWMLIAMIGLSCGLMPVAGAGQARKPNEWAMNNATIGPDSPIEMRAGSTYTAQAMYPVPDGPLFALKAKVTWAIEPAVKGISVDPNTGKITAAASVDHGATATIRANVNNGQRRLKATLYVFREELNPLVGSWSVDPKVACGEKQEPRAPEPRQSALAGREWKFHVDGQFWVGREMGIAAGILLSGRYELNLKDRKLSLTPQWPAHQPASAWKYAFAENGAKLLLRPLNEEYGSESGCSYVLHRR